MITVDSILNNQAVDAINAFTRMQMREYALYRKILHPSFGLDDSLVKAWDDMTMTEKLQHMAKTDVDLSAYVRNLLGVSEAAFLLFEFVDGDSPPRGAIDHVHRRIVWVSVGMDWLLDTVLTKRYERDVC